MKLIFLVYLIFLVPSILISLALEKRGCLPWNPKNAFEDLVLVISIWFIAPIAIPMALVKVLKDKGKTR